MNDSHVAPRFLKPVSLFFSLMLIVFAIETLVMYLLEALLRDIPAHVLNLIDSMSLSILSAPFIWWLIVRPFHNLALAEKSRTEQTLKYIVDAVINVDENGAIESINPAAVSAFGYSAQEIVGRDIAVIIPEFSSGLTSVRPEEVTGGAVRAFRARQETIGYRKDGVCFPVQISISSLQMGALVPCCYHPGHY